MVTVNNFLQDIVDAIEDRGVDVASKRMPKIKSRVVNKICDYVERFGNWVYRIDPRNWAWE